MVSHLKSEESSFCCDTVAVSHAAKLASIPGIPESVPATVFLAYGGSLMDSVSMSLGEVESFGEEGVSLGEVLVWACWVWACWV